MFKAVAAVPALAVALVTAVAAQDVPYEKYALPNGMTVILHEDHTLPIAGVNIWYYVGSKDEPRGSRSAWHGSSATGRRRRAG